MSKPGVIVGTFLALAAGFIGILFYLSYGVKTAPPARHPIQGLAETVSIYWAEEGPVHIQAERRGDFYTALGYVHGMNRPWISLLMRQASLGKLSEWFGQEAWDEDRLARSLELAKDARRSFDSL
ncbi:MAG: penicillin acylase family protein, partial [Bacteroidetes bacterium]|nr:penicillin acylase family protein [Bacteroidota bacterium]